MQEFERISKKIVRMQLVHQFVKNLQEFVKIVKKCRINITFPWHFLLQEVFGILAGVGGDHLRKITILLRFGVNIPYPRHSIVLVLSVNNKQQYSPAKYPTTLLHYVVMHQTQDVNLREFEEFDIYFITDLINQINSST